MSDWSGLTPAQLIDRLEGTHHAYLRETLPRLSDLIAGVAAAHRERHPELVEIGRLFGHLRADLEPHLMKEERVLFPMIRELAAAEVRPTFHCGTLANPIRMMEFEHETATELLAQLRVAANDYTVQTGASAPYVELMAGLEELEADTHLHIERENEILFPAVVAAEAALSEELG